MKCPKCGFNSFEYYDSCKKCSSDLTGYKQTHSITALILPLEAKQKLAADFMSADSSIDQDSDSPEKHDDIFAFDLPDDSLPTSGSGNDDPFNFETPTAEARQSNKPQSEDDVFADLLESTSQNDESPFAAAPATTAPSADRVPESTSAPGEFDLESFSWEESPVAATDSDSTAVTDDFDSLFGDTKENTQK